ncbi:protein SRG1-like [Chenopodium quinoa]|uniref:protein SRG1-like n=1 Tax=Chenopodium quinoa TaxID=63459 RepID=UPI000B781E98|nr:protein SRG1-like [Chenopodium quinoa]
MDESRKEDVISRLVQEIAKKGEEVPQKYIIKNDVISSPIDASTNLWQEMLLIDFDLISSGSSSAHQHELSKLHSAFKNWGCFQVINHGMTSLLLDELLDVSRQFFALPLEEKLNYSAMEEDVYSGYGNSAVLAGAEDKPINWNYRLFRTVYPEDQRKIQFWPQKPQKFSLQVISNGIFKSVVQRVMTNSERERYSVTAFYTLEPENDVGPINELISVNQPEVYKKLSMKIYDQLFLETFSQDIRVLDALRIKH